MFWGSVSILALWSSTFPQILRNFWSALLSSKPQFYFLDVNQEGYEYVFQIGLQQV